MNDQTSQPDTESGVYDLNDLANQRMMDAFANDPQKLARLHVICQAFTHVQQALLDMGCIGRHLTDEEWRYVFGPAWAIADGTIPPGTLITGQAGTTNRATTVNDARIYGHLLAILDLAREHSFAVHANDHDNGHGEAAL